MRAIITYNKHDAEEACVHLVLGVWSVLFQPIWENRNEQLHGSKSIVEQNERQQLISDLTEWKRDSHPRLGAHQQYLLHYNISDLTQWKTSSLREMSSLLTHASRNYQQSLLDGKQQLITNYFQPLDTNLDTDSDT